MPRRSSRLLLRKQIFSDKDEVAEILEKTEEHPANGIIVIDDTKESEYTKCDDGDTDTSCERAIDETNVSDDDNLSDDSDDSDIEQFATAFADTLISKMKISSTGTSQSLRHPELQTQLKDPSLENKLPTCIDINGIDLESYITMDPVHAEVGRNKILDLYTSAEDKLLQNSVITADFEAKHEAPVEMKKAALQKFRKMEREKTTGKDWFHMKAPELTEEVKRDLQILQMRSVLDPKRFYKHNDRKTLPKYFQMGKIMDNPADFYSSRLPKKQRKATLADELLADAEFKNYQKRKYSEIVAKRRTYGGRKMFKKD